MEEITNIYLFPCLSIVLSQSWYPLCTKIILFFGKYLWNVKGVLCMFVNTVFGVDLKAKNFPSISDVFPDIVSLINLPSKIHFFFFFF